MASVRMPTHGSEAVARTRDQPSLLPFNRQLRNLVSISLRNLTLSTQHNGHYRSQTIDDDADPKTFISPSKLRALREEKLLEYSHSSSDLRRAHTEDAEGLEIAVLDGELLNASPRTSKVRSSAGSLRARPKRMRRRSTLDWANAGSGQRQDKLESVVQERMANVFFSLHVNGITEPIYVSETIDRTMDPTFRSMDLSRCASGVLRQSKISIRIWAQSLKTLQWRMLGDNVLSLSALHYVGKTLEHSHLGNEPNTLLFHFTDGVCTLPASVPIHTGHQAPPAEVDPTRQLRTSSFDALLRLAKLTDSIEDALSTRDMLAAQLDQLIQNHKGALTRQDRVGEIEDRLKTIEYATATVIKQVQKARSQIGEKKASLARRRELMANDQKAHDYKLARMHGERDELPHLRDDDEIRKKAVAAQRRRIVEELSEVYTIAPMKDGKTLAFKIRNLPLPNSEELDGTSSSTVAAAFGYAAHTTQLLSFYLDIPLPYPVTPMGSTSWISDPISLLNAGATSSSVLSSALPAQTDKVFPLHLNRVARFRFEYGVFLLNKNIQLLLESGYGVRVLDVRQTLPNLKYLMYVATAGEGDMPARKAGGIRGLVNIRHSLSRASSSSSMTLNSGNAPMRVAQKDDNKAVQSLRNLVKS